MDYVIYIIGISLAIAAGSYKLFKSTKLGTQIFTHIRRKLTKLERYEYLTPLAKLSRTILNLVDLARRKPHLINAIISRTDVIIKDLENT